MILHLPGIVVVAAVVDVVVVHARTPPPVKPVPHTKEGKSSPPPPPLFFWKPTPKISDSDLSLPIDLHSKSEMSALVFPSLFLQRSPSEKKRGNCGS